MVSIISMENMRFKQAMPVKGADLEEKYYECIIDRRDKRNLFKFFN